jgi:hypothetical protein
MGGATCAQCGYVRWNRNGPCPHCGTPPVELLRDSRIAPNHEFTGAEKSAWTRQSTQVDDVPDRRRIEDTRRPSNLPAGAAIAVAVGIVLIFILATHPGYLGLGHSTPPPQVILPSGRVWPGDSGAGFASYGFVANQSGVLQGSFASANLSVEICVTSYFLSGLHPPQTNSSLECPANATYSTGFVDSGHLDVPVNGGWVWLGVFPYDGNSGDPAVWNVTWTTPLEVVFGP